MHKVIAIAALLSVFIASPALANRDHWRGRGHHDHGWHRPRASVSLNFGGPVYYPRHHYYRPAPVYYPQPVYYQPPQPQVIYINNPPQGANSSDDRFCREYTSQSNIAGRYQQTYGTACLQPDGSWEIMS